MQENERGLFIVVEGIDGCGKYTQVSLLAAHIVAATATVPLCLADPSIDKTGLAIRKVLLDKEIPLDAKQQVLLYTAARITPATLARAALAKGTHVICERWVLSTFVYQGIMAGVSKELITDLHDEFVGIDPDCYILLDVPVQQAKMRLNQAAAANDRFESRDDAWWEGLRDAYLQAAAELGITVVDGTGHPDKVAARIRAVCEKSPLWHTAMAGA